jgi:hypothetical protein
MVRPTASGLEDSPQLMIADSFFNLVPFVFCKRVPKLLSFCSRLALFAPPPFANDSICMRAFFANPSLFVVQSFSCRIQLCTLRPVS